MLSFSPGQSNWDLVGKCYRKGRVPDCECINTIGNMEQGKKYLGLHDGQFWVLDKFEASLGAQALGLLGKGL